jgi:hypothetical protein
VSGNTKGEIQAGAHDDPAEGEHQKEAGAADDFGRVGADSRVRVVRAGFRLFGVGAERLTAYARTRNAGMRPDFGPTCRTSSPKSTNL